MRLMGFISSDSRYTLHKRELHNRLIFMNLIAHNYSLATLAAPNRGIWSIGSAKGSSLVK